MSGVFVYVTFLISLVPKSLRDESATRFESDKRMRAKDGKPEMPSAIILLVRAACILHVCVVVCVCVCVCVCVPLCGCVCVCHCVVYLCVLVYVGGCQAINAVSFIPCRPRMVRGDYG